MDVRITGAEAGPQDGAPIVLLHGGASTRHWWDAVAHRLAARHRVLWWDQRGHGESGDARGDCTIARMATDTTEVLAELGLGAVTLVGHSAGAAVALRAARSPRVARVVCVDGGVYEPRAWLGPRWETLVCGRRPLRPEVLDAWREGVGLPPEALPAVLANHRPDAAGLLTPRISAEDDAQLARSLWEEDLAAVLADVDVEVTALLADDGLSRDAALALARATLGPALTERWIAGGHHLPLERPEAVAREIERVVAGAAKDGEPHVALAS
jgi:pimeloyl-ACP methyl ester carboxylesterase